MGFVLSCQPGLAKSVEFNVIHRARKKKQLLHAFHLTWDQEYILIITFQFKDLHRVILQDNGLDSFKSVGWPMWTNQVTLQTVQSPRTNDVTVLTENTHESDSEHI